MTVVKKYQNIFLLLCKKSIEQQPCYVPLTKYLSWYLSRQESYCGVKCLACNAGQFLKYTFHVINSGFLISGALFQNKKSKK